MKRVPSMTKPTGRKPMRIGALLLKEVAYQNEWRIQATWRDPDRKKKWFNNWRHAEEFAAKENKRLDELKEKGAGRFTGNDAFDSYLREREALSRRKDNDGCTLDTLRNERDSIENHLRPKFGHMRLAEISSVQIKDWVIEQNELFKTRTVDKYLARLKSILNHAVERKLLLVNPLTINNVRVPGKRSKRAKIPARSDLEVLREYLNQPRPLNKHRFGWSCRRMVLLLSISCGLRVGEISALDWDDIDRETGEIEISKSRAPLQGLKAPKTLAGNRKIPTTPRARQIIDEHAEVYKQFYGKCVGPVLRSVRLDFMAGCEVSRIFRETMRDCGVVDPQTNQIKFTCHAARHWCASHWLRSTGDIHQTKTWMGHQNASMTLDTYGHVLDNPEARAKFERMPDWLTPVIENDAASAQQSPLVLPSPEDPFEFDSDAGNRQVEPLRPFDVPSIAEPWVKPFIELLRKGMSVVDAQCEITPQVPNLRSTKNPQPLRLEVVQSRVAREFRRLKLPSPKTLASRFRDEKILALHAQGNQTHDIANILGCGWNTAYRAIQSRHKPNARNPLNRKLKTPRPNARKPQPEHKVQLKLL